MAVKIHKPQIDQNTFEIAKEVSHSVVKSFKNDLLEHSINDAWNQLLGTSRKVTREDIQTPINEGPQMSGDLIEGQEIEMNIFEKTQWKNVEPAINYASEIIHAETRIRNKEQSEQHARVEQIRVEIIQIANAPAQSQEVKNIAVESAQRNVGVYHQEHAAGVLKTARTKASEGSDWINAIKHKVEKTFWGKAKKYGTSFSQSDERNAALQTG